MRTARTEAMAMAEAHANAAEEARVYATDESKAAGAKAKLEAG